MEGPNKRIQNEIAKIQIFQQKGKLPANWKYLGPEINDGIPNYKVFIFSWQGVSGDMKGGIYNAQIKLPNDLATTPPRVYMMNNFQHMHVYAHGMVCFPFIDMNKWKPTIQIIDIAQELEKMLIQPPDVNDSANLNMLNIYKKNPEEYYQFIRDQAQKFKNQIPYLPQ